LYTGESVKQFKLGVAGIITEFVADDSLRLVVLGPNNRFVVSEGEPDLSFKVHYGPLPDLKLEERLFDSGGVWALYRSNGSYAITLSTTVFGPAPYRVAVIDSKFERGELYIRPVSDSRRADSAFPLTKDSLPSFDPTGYPLDEVLIMNLLSRGRGIELHSCGVALDGKGLLFSGVSGAGKSTLANLWKKRKDVPIFSDDRIIVRRINGRFWMFGTPWHGDAMTHLPQGAPLEKVFLIKQSPENYARPLEASDAASRLIVRCFPTFFDRSGMLYTLSVAGEIAEQVPCYELGFLPDESILDFVSKM
jgi:hypothetical protein